MPDFLSQFNLFGMAVIALIVVVVNGVKSVGDLINRPLSPIASVVSVLVVSWLLFGMHALVTYLPQSEPYVRYALAGLLGPLSAMGLYDMGKNGMQMLAGIFKAGK